MSSLLDFWREGLVTAAMVAAPLVIGALAVGVLTSLIQAATQMNDSSFSFVPKLLAIGLVLAMFGHGLLDRLSHFTSSAVQAAGDVGVEDRQ
ncbi:MAG TPA: flagellar biosynthetic protein FliQ [Kofleriaceae bacterium]|nr:flagellar biosynthetic protein FliQ [Kofleriaceae bacterium]